MLHILGFTLLFPAMCLLIVSVPNGFELFVGAEAILLMLWVAYTATILPGLVAGVADYLLLRFNIRFRFVYCALVAAIVSPIVGMWYYPGTPYYFVKNIVFYASLGALSAALCSLMIRAMRYRTHVNP